MCDHNSTTVNRLYKAGTWVVQGQPEHQRSGNVEATGWVWQVLSIHQKTMHKEIWLDLCMEDNVQFCLKSHHHSVPVASSLSNHQSQNKSQKDHILLGHPTSLQQDFYVITLLVCPGTHQIQLVPWRKKKSIHCTLLWTTPKKVTFGLSYLYCSTPVGSSGPQIQFSVHQASLLHMGWRSATEVSLRPVATQHTCSNCTLQSFIQNHLHTTPLISCGRQL